MSTEAASGRSRGFEQRMPASELVRNYGIYIVFIVLFVAIAFVEPRFRSEANLINLLRQNSIIGIMACGMTFAIVLGGLDLSVGAVAAGSSVVAAES